MSEKKDQLEEILKDQFYREAKKIEEEVGLNDDSEEISEELKARMKKALDQKIRKREMRAKVAEDDEQAEKAKSVEVQKDEDAYAGLSEEDREALRLGREMLKNQSDEKKVRTTRRKKRNIRRIVALAAVLILVMAVGMTSFGGPERMLQFMKSTVGGRQVSQVDSSDKNKIIEEEDEEKAYEMVADEFGVAPVRITWIPEKMKFKKMLFDQKIQVAEMIYWYNGEKVEFMIGASYGEMSWGYDEEDEILDHYYEKVQDTTIEVTKYEIPESDLVRYVAEFEYKKLHYCLAGQMTVDEMENILKNLYFM